MTIPFRLANGVGNKPDADRWMANYDWLTAILDGNFLLNGGQEVWGTTSFTNPADAAALSTNWTNVKSGTSAPTVNVTRESATKDTGSYSLKGDITVAGSANSIWGVKQSIANYTRFAGRTVIVGGMVLASTAGKARLKITDGTTTQHTGYHTGGGTFEHLQIPITVGSSPSELTVSLEVTSDFTGAVYLDSTYVYDIPALMGASAKAALTYRIIQDPEFADFLLKTGGTMTGDIAMGGNSVTNFKNPLFSYRRPALKWVSATQIDVENNTGTANETSIIFPDGEYRTVTEDTASTHKYRRFDITADAEFTSGTEDSGLRAALTEATDTWYAIYAVKSAIDSTKFVLVGDTTLPLQASFATLNTAYGTNGWVYLGLIRNGDGNGSTGDIVRFDQAGNVTTFHNQNSGTTHSSSGIIFGTSASATTLDWTYASGTAGAQLPSYIKMGWWSAGFGASAAARGSAGHSLAPFGTLWMGEISIITFARFFANHSTGVQVTSTAAVSLTLWFSGFVDPILASNNAVL